MSNIISYPTSPTTGQEFTVGNTIKVWDGEKCRWGCHHNSTADQ